MSGKPRFYDEAKAKRVSQYQHIFQNTLVRLLRTRTKREQELKAEIDAIAAAYVDLKCGTCRKLIRVKFKDWQAKKYSTVCSDCTNKQERKDLDELHIKISPFIPDGYEIKYDSYYNSRQVLAIRKKKE